MLFEADVPVEVVLEDEGGGEILLDCCADGVDVCAPGTSGMLVWLFLFLTLVPALVLILILGLGLGLGLIIIPGREGGCRADLSLY